MSVLILAEHSHTQLAPATAKLVGAAIQLGGDVHVLVAGNSARAAAEQAASLEGVAKVLLADDAAYTNPLAENIAPLIVALASNYTHVLAAASSTGKDVLPRAAALLDVAQISEAVKILSSDTFVRPIYAGNALETVQSNDSIKLLTIRTTAFASVASGGNAPVENVSPVASSDKVSFVKLEASISARPELTAARVVVSGGRGMGSAEQFKTLEQLADRLGAAIGASRAAVDAGFVPNDLQVGQTGKIVAPELYIAVGISGAIQHLAGMKDSKIIVAINKDENAPIFEVADFGLVAQWQEVLPELLKLLGPPA